MRGIHVLLTVAHVAGVAASPECYPESRSLLQTKQGRSPLSSESFAEEAWPHSGVDEDCHLRSDKDTALQRVALFVMWNYEINASIAAELTASYQPWFASVDHIGGNETACNPGLTGGWFMYQCYADAAMRRVDQSLDGFLFVADDAAFKPWELKKLGLIDTGKFWLPLANLSAHVDLRSYDYAWPEERMPGTGFVALRSLMAENNDLEILLRTRLKCAEPCAPPHAIGDVLYLPRSHAANFSELAKLFRYHRVFTEIALPSIVAALVDEATLNAAWEPNGRLVWSLVRREDDQDAVRNVMAVHPDQPAFLHPLKQSRQENQRAWHRWFHKAGPCEEMRALVKAITESKEPSHALQSAIDIVEPSEFTAVNFRSYKLGSSPPMMVQTTAYELHGFPSGCQGAKYWVVLTSINEAGAGVRRLDKLSEGWCVLVVGDLKTPKAAAYLPNATRVFYLSPEEQKRLPLRTIPLTPWNHFTRKNIGYLVAAALGAEAIYDTDDDNILKDDATPPMLQGSQHVRSVGTAPSAANIYALFSPSAAGIYPRGLPLQAAASQVETKDIPFQDAVVEGKTLAIQQSLVDGDSDVDAIFRLSHQSSGSAVSFDSTSTTVVLTPGTPAPSNSQATTFLKAAFPTMFLPASVHPRVADIWRGYFALPVLWQHGLSVAYVAPRVTQVRNSHNLTEDLYAEWPLYHKATSLAAHVSNTSRSDLFYGVSALLRSYGESTGQNLHNISIPEAVFQVHLQAFERGFIEESDLLISKAFLEDLLHPPQLKAIYEVASIE